MATNNQQDAKVDTPSLAQQAMIEQWELIDDLLGGTEAMREKGETWLPREPKEKPKNWRVRRDRSFLHPALEDTIERMTAKPFEQAVTCKADDLPELIQPIVDDVDLMGTSLTEFARQAFKMAGTYGLVHCLVDAPSNPERRADPQIRPYFILVPPYDLIGGDYSRDEYGRSNLSRVRIKRTRTQAIPGSWGQQEIEAIQVYGWNAVAEYVRAGYDGDYEPVGEPVEHSYGSTSPMRGGIPFATLYFDKAGELKAKPPLRKLAWANLEHWQKASDLSNIVRFASIGTLLIKGLSAEEVEDKDQTIGPQNFIKSSSDTADGKVIEHSGKAVGTIEEHVRRIEERMEILGLEPYMRKTGSETATGKAMHGAKSESQIKQWIRAEQRWLRQLFIMAARWLDSAYSGGASSVEIPEDWKIKIFDDFQIPILAGVDDIDRLLKARQQSELSHETFIEECKRRGFLSDDVTSGDELERLESEPRTGMGSLAFLDGGQDQGGAQGAA